MKMKSRLLYGLVKALFFALLWLRPLVHLPLQIISYASLLAFVVTLLMSGSELHTRLLLAGVGIGAIALSWSYDTLLSAMAGNGMMLVRE
ncbi:hypothetical protein [Candidatus Burkholderia verschuerenii]|uniref:hypothetical protein n=1 Tax=Candidatus Burkholderia verschuerenii TaxID=242163 RepID=UPI00067D2E20|nr:hypothetical protein [Candidatus Burkholderia verschuerenii]